MHTHKNNLGYLKTMLIYVNFHKIKHIYIYIYKKLQGYRL